jgi:hypothetical protein
MLSMGYLPKMRCHQDSGIGAAGATAGRTGTAGGGRMTGATMIAGEGATEGCRAGGDFTPLPVVGTGG